VKLRKYQKECVENIIDDIDQGHTKIICVAPTGSGKTVIFGDLTDQYLKANKDKRVVIVSHLGLLVEQTSERFKEDYGIETGVLQADRMPNKDARCIVSTMQSFRVDQKISWWARQLDYFDKSIDRINVGMIIIDEAHYVGSESYNTIMEMFPNTIIVGFTATPFRKNKFMVNLFEKVSFEISAKELIDMGYLVKPKLNVFKVNTDDEAEVYGTVLSIIKNKHPKDKCVVYMRTIKQAKDLRQVLVDNGIHAASVTSETKSKGERSKILNGFKQEHGGHQVLTTVDVLTAGFDAPITKAIIMPYPIKSVVTYLQRVGRGLRTYKGKDCCYVYAGSSAPKKEKGYWEKLQKIGMNNGRKDFDDYQEELDYGCLPDDTYTWTKEIVDMAEQARQRGMECIGDLIMEKRIYLM